MISFVQYEADTGRLLAFGICDQSSWDAQEEPKIEVSEKPDLSTDYVKDGVVLPRPKITDIIPAGSIVKISHERFGQVLNQTIDEDATVEFNLPVSGTYNITIKPPFPWCVTERTITL